MLQCSGCKERKSESEFSANAYFKTRKFNYYCKDCLMRRARLPREKRVDGGLCVDCGGNVPGGQNRCEVCRQKLQQRGQKLKIEVLNAYGGIRCVCCGEDAIEFLSIDHTEGNGKKHMRAIGCRGGSNFYHWLKRNHYPSGFQVLCLNCNFAKGHFGHCPHENKDPIVLNWNKEGDITYAKREEDGRGAAFGGSQRALTA